MTLLLKCIAKTTFHCLMYSENEHEPNQAYFCVGTFGYSSLSLRVYVCVCVIGWVSFVLFLRL